MEILRLCERREMRNQRNLKQFKKLEKAHARAMRVEKSHEVSVCAAVRYSKTTVKLRTY